MLNIYGLKLVIWLKQGDFSKVFNSVYEENMAKKIDKERYSWFSEDTPSEYDNGKKIKLSEMSAAIENVKQRQQAVAVYQGVKPIRYSNGNSFYDDDDEETSAPGNYIECDVFSKFKFDDIRKVHRDQTVINVTDRDCANAPKYDSVDQYLNARNKHTDAVMSKQESEALLQRHIAAEQHAFMRKQQRDLLLQKTYEEKQQSALSSFLQLGR